ncbi:MAG: gamma-glutamylcyclotransferase family protein [Planctomycetota bacterium]
MTRLFVYGTLKRGDCRAYLLGHAEYLGEARTTPDYRLYTHGPYPALVEAGRVGVSGRPIRGELYQVDSETLERLDEEEGVDEGLYERKDIALSGQSVGAQAYFYLHSIEAMVDCGEQWRVGPTASGS